MPHISVIVPVYRAEKYLHRCVDSILRQSYQDFELILVDDGSPDCSGSICDDYAVKDSRIHVIHQENAGCSAARNAGIEWALQNSDSQWISFVDSDDWLHKDFLKVLFNQINRWNAEIAMCGLFWTKTMLEDADLNEPVSIAMEPEQALVDYHPMCTGCCSKIIAKSIFKDLRFPVGMRYEDAYISHKMILLANNVCICTEKLYYYFYNPESFTRVEWTEGRLVAVRVHEERLAYFLENGYEKAYRKEQELYMEVLTDNLQCLMHLLDKGEIYRRNFRMIQKKHRQAFSRARTQKATSLRWETIWFYIFAMPGDVVWKTARFAQKVYHRIKK